MAEKIPKVRIKFQFPGAGSSVPVSGAWGGVTTTGDVQMSLYQDLLGEPETIVRDQESGEERSEGTRDTVPVTRQIHVTAIIRHDIARVIGEWLIRHADNAKAAIDKKKAGK